MKVSTAIKVLEGKVSGVVNPVSMRNSDDALKLGIEALKRIKKEREIQGGLYNYELTGETPEGG